MDQNAKPPGATGSSNDDEHMSAVNQLKDLGNRLLNLAKSDDEVLQQQVLDSLLELLQPLTVTESGPHIDRLREIFEFVQNGRSQRTTSRQPQQKISDRKQTLAITDAS